MKTSTSLPLHIKLRPRKPSGAGGAPAVPENITADWDDDTTDLTPDFALDSTEFAVNDVVEERRSPSDPTVTTYTSAQATIIAVDPGTGAITLDSTFDFSGNWAAGTWYVQFWLIRAAAEIGKSNIETLTLISTAPVLSSPRYINRHDDSERHGFDHRNKRHAVRSRYHVIDFAIGNAD